MPGLLKDLTYEDKNLKLKRYYKRQTSELFTLHYNTYLFKTRAWEKENLDIQLIFFFMVAVIRNAFQIKPGNFKK